jgi:hypothetical protein
MEGAIAFPANRIFNTIMREVDLSAKNGDPAAL